MMRLFKYWFMFNPAPDNIKQKVESMAAAFGYTSTHTDSNGDILVSEMFILHCKAASVSATLIYDVSQGD